VKSLSFKHHAAFTRNNEVTVVDFLENGEMIQNESNSIRQFLRGPSSTFLSSKNRGWSGVAIEHHGLLPGERPEAKIDCLLLALCCGQSVARGERLGSRGLFVPYVKPPGSFTLYAPGGVPLTRQTTVTNLLVCALNPDFIRSVGEELKGESLIKSASISTIIQEYRPAFMDSSLRRLLSLLEKEVAEGDLAGTLNTEHLAYELVKRLFGLTHSENIAGRSSIATARPNALCRVVERMQAIPNARFRLEELAAETGYSRGHFLRAFRASTGLTPHQYLLRLRVNRAKRLIQNKSMTLVEIALDCGFADQAHFSRVFTKHFGLNPSQYRCGQ
jgi:AraC family transcriptional regulator